MLFDAQVRLKKLYEVTQDHGYRIIKRGFDLIFSFVFLLLSSPLFIILALVIKISSEGPAFYVHKRVGFNGKPIELYKFRTMCIDADKKRSLFTKEQEQEWIHNYKLRNDPRLTKMGVFLRKTSLDELPQLLNILFGDLSFVGPRPVISEELQKYGDDKAKFLSVMPGLTGYWQAYARNECPYEQRIEMELYYVEHASLVFDVKILFATIGRVISQKGAL